MHMTNVLIYLYQQQFYTWYLQKHDNIYLAKKKLQQSR